LTGGPSIGRTALTDSPPAGAGDATRSPPGGSAGSGQPGGDEIELRESLTSLSRLATGQLSLEQILTQVAEFAVRAIPGADGAGLTLLENNRGDTIVATAPFVRAVDDIQYRIREGPCISAAAEGRTMRSGSLGGEPRWPRFGPRVSRLGVHSVLSLPLVTPDGVFGAMNVYAHDKNVFDERAAELGELFAAPAAIAVQNAQVLEQAKRLAATLQAVLTNRAIIDQALGIIISRRGCTSDEAYKRLREMSQSSDTKLGIVAQSIVGEAVRRAIARRNDH
jgi:GAF domain-containing protein